MCSPMILKERTVSTSGRLCIADNYSSSLEVLDYSYSLLSFFYLKKDTLFL